MSNFEYRVVAEEIIVENADGTENEVEVFHFAEVEYDEDGKILSHFLLSDDEFALMKDSKEGLRAELELLIKSLSKPAIRIQLAD